MQGPFHAVSVILEEEGFRGLWSGATPTIMRNGTHQTCLFWAKNNLDRLLWGEHGGDGMQLTMLQPMGSGFSAACLGPLASGPFDVVKIKLLAFCSQLYSFRPKPDFGVHRYAEFCMELTRIMGRRHGSWPKRKKTNLLDTEACCMRWLPYLGRRASKHCGRGSCHTSSEFRPTRL